MSMAFTTSRSALTYEHTFLTERDAFGLVDPTANAPCLNADGSAYTDPLLTDPANCTGALQPNLGQGSVPAFIPLLACYDLTRTAALPASDGCPNSTSGDLQLLRPRRHQGIRLLRQDTINVHNWTFNLGLRFDKYNGIVSAAQAEPRLGIAYNIKPSQYGSTGVLRPDNGDSFQREPGAGEPGMHRAGDRRVPDTCRGRRLRDNHAVESRSSQ